MGVLDARLLPVPHGRISNCGINLLIIFIGLTLIYLVKAPTRLAGWNAGARTVALLQCLTGIWLMYCTWAVTVNLALGYKLWI